MNFFKVLFVLLGVLHLSTYSSIGGTRGSRPYTYAVVIKESTYKIPGWKAVADTLLSIHGETDSRLFTYVSSPTDVKSQLANFMPDYIAVVGKGGEDINDWIIKQTYLANRSLDSDPYPDAVLGFVTGYKAADALRAVTDTLRVKTGLHATEGPELSISTGKINGKPKIEYKDNNGGVLAGPDIGKDRCEFLVNTLNNGVDITINGKHYKQPVDVFGTGGHGLESVWQIHYPDKSPEGMFRSSKGQLYGQPYSGENININKKTPTVYLAINNCLIGNPNNLNNMVYAWFHSGRAVQMFGFTPLCKGSLQGFSVRSRMRNPGINPTEAYFLSECSLVWEKETKFINNWNDFILDHNLEGTVMYGDPKANVLCKEGDAKSINSGGLSSSISYSAEREDGYYLFELKTEKVVDTLRPWGAWKRDKRPIFPLPVKIDPSTIEVIQDDTYGYEIIDNVVMIEAWGAKDNLPTQTPKGTVKVLKWRAKVIKSDLVNMSAAPAKNTILKPAITLIKSRLDINLGKAYIGSFVLKIIDAKGRIAMEQTKNIKMPKNTVSIHLSSGLVNGNYFITIKGEDLNLSGKMVLLR